MSVSYGQPLRGLGPGARADWLVESVGSDAVLLPNELTGVAGWRRGLIVLPDACDVAHEPTFVSLTVRDPDADSARSRLEHTGDEIGTPEAVGESLVATANRGMAHAGCAPEEPLRISAAWPRLPEEGEAFRDEACRIPGLTFTDADADNTLSVESQVGPVGDTLRSCSLSSDANVVHPDMTLLMTSEPWLTAPFSGGADGTDPGPLPEGWRGTGSVSAAWGRRAGRVGGVAPTVFAMRGDPDAPVFGPVTVESLATFGNAGTPPGLRAGGPDLLNPAHDAAASAHRPAPDTSGSLLMTQDASPVQRRWWRRRLPARAYVPLAAALTGVLLGPRRWPGGRTPCRRSRATIPAGAP